jgi:hypothetical protein
MADYNSTPLWWTGGECGSILLEELPLTNETRARLATWAGKYDATLNMKDPASSGLRSADERHAFIKEGSELLRSVKRELGPDYEVTYRTEDGRDIVE